MKSSLQALSALFIVIAFGPVAALAQAPLAPQPCAQLSSRRPTSGTTSTLLAFNNLTAEALSMGKVNSNGTETQVIRVGPGKSALVTVTTGQLLVVRDASARCVGVYPMAVTAPVITIRQELVPPRVSAQPAPARAAREGRPLIPGPVASTSAAKPPAQPSVNAPVEIPPTRSAPQRESRPLIPGPAPTAGTPARKPPAEPSKNVAVLSPDRLRQRVREVFTVTYDIFDLQRNPSDWGDNGRAVRFRDLVLSMTPSPALRQATEAWYRSDRLGDLDIFDRADALQAAWVDFIRDGEEPLLDFGDLGAVASIVNKFYLDTAAMIGNQELLRVTKKPEYQERIDSARSRLNRQVEELKQQTDDAIRMCLRWRSQNLCPASVADAFQRIRTMLNKQPPHEGMKEIRQILDAMLLAER